MLSLTLSDGTVYELDWCHADKGIFNANIKTADSFVEIAMKFGNRELTSRMIAKYGEDHEDVYEGYTELQSIQLDGWETGSVLITLFNTARANAA